MSLLMHSLMMESQSGIGEDLAYLMEVAKGEQGYAGDWCSVECQSQHIQLLR